MVNKLDIKEEMRAICIYQGNSICKRHLDIKLKELDRQGLPYDSMA
jgi:hypothetical protein